LPNVRGIEIKSRKNSGSVVEFVNEWRGGGDIPAALRAVLSQSVLSWTDFATWRRDGVRLANGDARVHRGGPVQGPEHVPRRRRRPHSPRDPRHPRDRREEDPWRPVVPGGQDRPRGRRVPRREDSIEPRRDREGPREVPRRATPHEELRRDVSHDPRGPFTRSTCPHPSRGVAEWERE